jgi:hypothetical protein
MLSTLTRQSSRAIRFALLFGAVIGSAACSDDTTESRPDPVVATAQLLFAVPPSGDITEYNFTGAAGETRVVHIQKTVPTGNTTVFIRWLRADGTEEVNATEDDYRLVITAPAGSPFAITQNLATQPFGAIIRADVDIPATDITMSLVRNSDNKVFFGPFVVSFIAP